MPALPSPVLRALEGLAEGSGRTVAIAGPPTSGKSALLEEMKGLLRARGARIVELRGTYRGRSVPYGALDGLRPEALAPVGIVPESSGDGSSRENGGPEGPLPGIPYLTDRLPRSRRSRAERPRATFLGQPIRGRSANEGDPESYWREILPELKGPQAHPIAILIDDGSLFDSESREFIVALSLRARLRPFLIVCALDTSVAGFMAWEEAFLGRGDVDWVRFAQSLPDPREAHRLKAVYDDLPTVSQRATGYVALLGGTVGEVVLSRVARLTFPQLAEALLPATGVGLIKVQDGKVTIPHQAWIPLSVDLIPEKQRREMHLEIANALSALSPEPSLARRTEVARHYLAWFPGPMALRHLLDAAEISLELLAFDSAEALLAEAIGCLASLPPAERDPLEPELRLLHSRALFSCGRLHEGESELREGLDDALRAKIASETLTEWLEPLLLTMRVVGPRPSLATVLLELIERCHDAEMVEVEVLFEALVAEFHYERGWPDKARSESHRAALLARKLPEGHLQALALLAVGLSRIEGTPEEQSLAERFLRAARTLLGRARRWELDALAEDLEARLLDTRGEHQRARELRERMVPVLQRMHLLSLELYTQLGIVESLLNRENPKGVEVPLERAHAIVETLHLLPPSPGLLGLWLLEGRYRARNDAPDEARDRWEAILDEPGPATIPRIRAEAIVRLALLEYALRPERAAEVAALLTDPEVVALLPTAWRSFLLDLPTVASRSEHGGGPLPPPSADRRKPSERRERPRREAV
ncbi:MAG: ATP-binding protein [Thermoplasmata archaeon]